MRNANRWAYIGLFLLFAAFFAGAAHLFMLRYEVGDVYQPYSTFRADPLGAKAFCEALEQIPSLQTQRNVQPLKKLEPSPSLTLFIIGVSPNEGWWEESKENAALMEAVANAGGRLVVAFAPTRSQEDAEPVLAQLQKRRNQDEDKDKDKEKKNPEAPLDLREVWNVDLDKPAPPSDDGQEDTRQLIAITPEKSKFPATLNWHSIAYFKPTNDAWKTVYTCDGNPVLIERPLGNGSLVFISDSFLFSNEAMRKGPATTLLSWLMGSNGRMVFDEVHFGIVEKQGVMTLARKLRLHGFAVGTLVLIVLFLWKNLVRLTPPYDDEFDRTAWYSKGREAAEGLTNLLRRSVAPRDLLQTCLNEWKRVVGMRRPESQKKLEKMQAIVDANTTGNAATKDLVVAYREMVRIATERK